jgi:hypothetical protein
LHKVKGGGAWLASHCLLRSNGKDVMFQADPLVCLGDRHIYRQMSTKPSIGAGLPGGIRQLICDAQPVLPGILSNLFGHLFRHFGVIIRSGRVGRFRTMGPAKP